MSSDSRASRLSARVVGEVTFQTLLRPLQLQAWEEAILSS